jgi:hypothetical protein
MLTEYVEEALRRALYDIIPDPFYGEVEELSGVCATGKKIEECRSHGCYRGMGSEG